MARTDTDQGLMLTTLRAADAPVVRGWLRDFLRHHGRTWARAMALGWTDSEVDAQQMASDLLERHWQTIRVAARSDGHFVAIARLDGRPVGVVWCEVQRQPYLDIPVGVLSWIYVARWARRHHVGTALIEAAKDWLRMRSVKGWQVSVLYDNEPAMALYRRAGLEVADVRMMGELR